MFLQAVFFGTHRNKLENSGTAIPGTAGTLRGKDLNRFRATRERT